MVMMMVYEVGKVGEENTHLDMEAEYRESKPTATTALTYKGWF